MKPTTTDEKDEWKRKDAWLGLLFLAAGFLMIAYVYLLIRNLGDSTAPLSVVSLICLAFMGFGGVLMGPFLVFLGGNAVVRSFRAKSGRMKKAGKQQVKP